MNVVNGIAAAAVEYACQGWHVVPLHSVTNGVCSCPKGSDCPSPGKHPRLGAWQDHATADTDVVERWFYSEFPDSNLGVILGPRSGIIDIECDDEDAEKTLLGMFGGEFPYTPTFKSSRGKHRLFKWRDNLPGQGLNGFKIGKLEFRTGNGGKGAQSVFPPSRHATGAMYEWVIHPNEADLCELSDELVAKLWNCGGEDVFRGAATPLGRPSADWLNLIRNGVKEGSRNVEATSLIGRLLLDQRDLNNTDALSRLWELVRIWNQQCDPPQGEDAVWATFTSVLNSEKASRSSRKDIASGITPALDETKPGAMPEWKAERIDSDPPVYRLYSPYWSLRAPHGYVELSAEQMRSPEQICTAVLHQAHVWVNAKAFASIWNGNSKEKIPSKAKELVDDAVRIEPAVELKRPAIIAGVIVEVLGKAQALGEGKHPPRDGRPVRDDTSVIFRFEYVVDQFSRMNDKVQRKEIDAVLVQSGVESRVMGEKSKRQRYRVASDESLQMLRELSGIKEE